MPALDCLNTRITEVGTGCGQLRENTLRLVGVELYERNDCSHIDVDDRIYATWVGTLFHPWTAWDILPVSAEEVGILFTQ